MEKCEIFDTVFLNGLEACAYWKHHFSKIHDFWNWNEIIKSCWMICTQNVSKKYSNHDTFLILQGFTLQIKEFSVK